MEKIDLKKQLKHLYKPSAKKMEIVDVPPMNFLMIDGEGDPNTSQEYREAIEALFGMSYTIKFTLKKSDRTDYGVMPLEGLWWTDDMTKFTPDDKSNWKWTAMIMQPGFVTVDDVEKAMEEVAGKKNPPALPKVRFEKFEEGISAQVMHTGPYAEEAPTIKKLHEFIKEQGYELRGKHHEIYLSDPRKCKPESLKTVIRQPVGK